MGFVADSWRDTSWGARLYLGVIVVALLVGAPIAAMLGHEARLQVDEQLRQDVAEGRRLASGEVIIRDTQTGCQYIRVVSYVSDYYRHAGYTLVPRLGQDGKPMGCGSK